jgi:hypothetical protein
MFQLPWKLDPHLLFLGLNLIKFANASPDTLITAFPKRYGRNEPDPSSVYENIKLRLEYIGMHEVRSVYDLALVVIDECSKVFSDQSKVADMKPHAMDIFSEAIAKIVSPSPLVL